MADFSVSQQELASWLDLSTRRVRELTTIGVLTKGDRRLCGAGQR